ncbi:MAG TPA: hypothetical protein VMX97_06335 [Hyphomicrobiaceae bacterium]|nr:hypothetical protein [Hyphomicrobiaceae bacterium]
MAEEHAGNGVESKFGTCCEELKEAIAGEDFEPLISEGPEGILYMAVGLIELEDEEPGMVDHPLFHCPFCGVKLQDSETVKAQLESQGEPQQ